MPDTRYVKKAYVMLLQDMNNGTKNWVWGVKNIVMSLGFGYVWEVQTVSNISLFVSEFCHRLKCCYEQTWHSAIHDGSKYYHYSLYKTIFSVEP